MKSLAFGENTKKYTSKQSLTNKIQYNNEKITSI